MDVKRGGSRELPVDVKRERESKSYQRTLRGGKGSRELPVDVKRGGGGPGKSQ